MEVGAPIPPPADGDVVVYTATFNQVLEATIRRAPEQWLWMHARWRTQPKEAAS